MGKQLPYRYGDVCKYVGKDTTWEGEHIIEEASHTGNDEYEYSTSQGAWIQHADLILLKQSSVESRKKLHAVVEEDGEY